MWIRRWRFDSALRDQQSRGRPAPSIRLPQKDMAQSPDVAKDGATAVVRRRVGQAAGGNAFADRPASVDLTEQRRGSGRERELRAQRTLDDDRAGGHGGVALDLLAAPDRDIVHEVAAAKVDPVARLRARRVANAEQVLGEGAA